MPDIWLPPEKLQRITVYVDETYLHRHTGIIKAAIAIPDAAREPFERAMVPVVAVHRKDEFKAGDITGGNVGVYREFLRFVVNVIAETGLQSPLRSIVSVESMSIYRSNLCSSVRQAFEKAFARNGVDTKLVIDMAELTVWCGHHLRYVLPEGAANPFALVLDERYRNDLRVAEQKWFNSPTLGFATPMVLRDILPGLLNVGLRLLRSTPKWTVPAVEVVNVDFVQSSSSIYLQAADLISNLAFNYLLYKKGVRTKPTCIKHDLFAGVMDGGEPSEDFMRWLQVVDEGQGGIKLSGGSDMFAGRLTLGSVGPGT